MMKELTTEKKIKALFKTYNNFLKSMKSSNDVCRLQNALLRDIKTTIK